MRINKSTDYAIKILLYLANRDGQVSSSELSKQLSISKRYLLQIAAKLRDAGIVCVFKGTDGGYKLIKEIDDISLYLVFNLMQDSTHLIPCSAEIKSPSGNFRDLHITYWTLQQHINTFLEAISIEMLLGKIPAQKILTSPEFPPPSYDPAIENPTPEKP